MVNMPDGWGASQRKKKVKRKPAKKKTTKKKTSKKKSRKRSAHDEPHVRLARVSAKGKCPIRRKRPLAIAVEAPRERLLDPKSQWNEVQAALSEVGTPKGKFRVYLKKDKRRPAGVKIMKEPTRGVNRPQGPGPRWPLTVACGLGVDSIAILVGLVQLYRETGDDKWVPVEITFADTGCEHPETYAMLGPLNDYLCKNGFPSVTVVCWTTQMTGSGKAKRGEKGKGGGGWGTGLTLECNVLNCHTVPSICTGGHGCSLKFKIEPQQKYLKKVSGLFPLKDKRQRVVRAIGYDVTEAGRLIKGGTYVVQREEEDKDFAGWYPLIEWGWDRARCIAEIAVAFGSRRRPAWKKVPRKSSCWFCGAMRPDEIALLGQTHSDLLKRAILIEQVALKGRWPLTEVPGLNRAFSWKDFALGNLDKLPGFARALIEGGILRESRKGWVYLTGKKPQKKLGVKQRRVLEVLKRRPHNLSELSKRKGQKDLGTSRSAAYSLEELGLVEIRPDPPKGFFRNEIFPEDQTKWDAIWVGHPKGYAGSAAEEKYGYNENDRIYYPNKSFPLLTKAEVNKIQSEARSWIKASPPKSQKGILEKNLAFSPAARKLKAYTDVQGYRGTKLVAWDQFVDVVIPKWIKKAEKPLPASRASAFSRKKAAEARKFAEWYLVQLERLEDLVERSVPKRSRAYKAKQCRANPSLGAGILLAGGMVAPTRENPPPEHMLPAPVPGQYFLPTAPADQAFVPVTIQGHLPPRGLQFELLARGQHPLVFVPQGAYEHAPISSRLHALLTSKFGMAYPMGWEDLLAAAGTRAKVFVVDRYGQRYEVREVLFDYGGETGQLVLRPIGRRGRQGDMVVDLEQAYGNMLPVVVYKPPRGRVQ